MYAMLAFIASFVMVFFIVLILSGVLLGLVAATAQLVEWIVAHEADSDEQQRRTLADQLRRERTRL